MHGMPRSLEYHFGPAAAFYSGSGCGFLWGVPRGREIRFDARHIHDEREIEVVGSSLVLLNGVVETAFRLEKFFQESQG